MNSYRFKEEDSNRLQEEYENMLRGLQKASEEKDADMVLANPVLPDDILKGFILELRFYLVYQYVLYFCDVTVVKVLYLVTYVQLIIS